MLRWLAVLPVLMGCDQLFGLQHVGPKADAMIDSMVDAPPDAALPVCLGPPPPTVEYDVASNPYSITLADLDGKNGLDIITPGATANALSILLNNGNGTFIRAPDVPTGAYPTRVVVGDFSGDGIADIVTTAYTSNTVQLMLGSGNGTFTQTLPINVGANPIGIATIPLDTMPPDDVVVTLQGGAAIQPLVVTAGRLTTTGSTIPTIAVPQDIAVADMNADGIPDMVVVGFNANTVSVHLGKSGGGFDPQIDTTNIGNGLSGVAVGKLDNDAYPDVAVSSSTGKRVDVLYGQGDGHFSTHLGMQDATAVWGIVLANTDLDGQLDLVYPQYNAPFNVRTFPGTGGIGFKPSRDATGFGEGEGIAVGNLDGLAPNDIVVANWDRSTVAVYLGCIP